MNYCPFYLLKKCFASETEEMYCKTDKIAINRVAYHLVIIDIKLI